ncbi:MAG: hypothetical protein LQ347_004022 [Umbilicaria vellea]|nr:MAG: hypothetical protein LQ347_004022 [Umbilicaria vellea]
MLAYASHIPKFACGDPNCDAQYCPVCFSRHSQTHQHPARFFNQVVFNVPSAVAKSPAVIQKADSAGAAPAANATPAVVAAEQAKTSTGWKNVLKPADLNHAAKWGVETAISSTTGVNVKMPKVDYVGLYKWGKKKAAPALAMRVSSGVLPATVAPVAGNPATHLPVAQPTPARPVVGNQAAVLTAAAQAPNTQAAARRPAVPRPVPAAQPARQPTRPNQPARPGPNAAARPNNANNPGYGNNSPYQNPNNSQYQNPNNPQYQNPNNSQYQDPNNSYAANAQNQDPSGVAYGNNTQDQGSNVSSAYGYNTQYPDNTYPTYGNNPQYQGNDYSNSNQYQANNNADYGGNMYYQDNSNSGGLDASDVLLVSAMVAPDASNSVDPSTINYMDPSAQTYTDPYSPPLASPNSFWSEPTGAGTPMLSPDPAETFDPYATSFDPTADATSTTGSLADPYASMEMGVDPEALTGESDQQSYTQTTTYEQTTTTYDDGNDTATYESTTFESTTTASDNGVDDTGYDS